MVTYAATEWHHRGGTEAKPGCNQEDCQFLQRQQRAPIGRWSMAQIRERKGCARYTKPRRPVYLFGLLNSADHDLTRVWAPKSA